tara:strand:+ start:167 stop:376 length:210 start_codon:yes stop_codon:yes gene_type:complete
VEEELVVQLEVKTLDLLVTIQFFQQLHQQKVVQQELQLMQVEIEMVSQVDQVVVEVVVVEQAAQVIRLQ